MGARHITMYQPPGNSKHALFSLTYLIKSKALINSNQQKEISTSSMIAQEVKLRVVIPKRLASFHFSNTVELTGPKQ